MVTLLEAPTWSSSSSATAPLTCTRRQSPRRPPSRSWAQSNWSTARTGPPVAWTRYASVPHPIFGHSFLQTYVLYIPHLHWLLGIATWINSGENVIFSINLNDLSNTIAQQIKQLHDNANMFRRRLLEMGLHVLGDWNSPVMPVMIYHPAKLPVFSRSCLDNHVAMVSVLDDLLGEWDSSLPEAITSISKAYKPP